jgi:hypothetical protein
MGAHVSSIDIDRRPEAVYAYVTDPTRFVEWQRDVVAAHIHGDGPVELGTRLTTTRRIGRTNLTMTQVVTSLDPPWRWSVHGTDGPLRPSMDIIVEPLDAGTRSRVTFTLDLEGRGLSDLLVPVVRRMADRAAPASYRRLKEQLEAS